MLWENLRAAIEGEDYETTEMYPSFAETAEAEGYPDVAAYFRQVGAYERKHRDRYRSALEGMGA
jgi:rubrerythrin